MKILRVGAELIQKNGLMNRQTDRGWYRHGATKLLYSILQTRLKTE